VTRRPSLAVDALAGGRPVWERRQLGSQASVVMVGPLSPDDRERARSSGLDLTSLSLQQVVVQAAAGLLAPVPQTGFETEGPAHEYLGQGWPRYNLVRPANYLVLPWILPFCFAVGAVTSGRRPPHDASGYLFTFFLYFALQGAQTIGQSLPFGLTLGASRRSFYFGTALLGMVSGLV
jgi:hypothetical protein